MIVTVHQMKIFKKVLAKGKSEELKERVAIKGFCAIVSRQSSRNLNSRLLLRKETEFRSCDEAPSPQVFLKESLLAQEVSSTSCTFSNLQLVQSSLFRRVAPVVAV